MLILVPVSQTAESDNAVELAANEAEMRGGEVLLVGHVHANPETEEDLSWLRQRLSDLEAVLTDRNITCDSEWSVGPHSLDERVIKIAQEREVDLIVMGLRQRSRVGKLIMGSYEQAVLLSAPCPVLTILHEG